MAGRKLISASLGFARYIKQTQERLKQDTGKRYSEREITAFLAAQQPIIKLEMNGKKKKNGTIFDF